MKSMTTDAPSFDQLCYLAHLEPISQNEDPSVKLRKTLYLFLLVAVCNAYGQETSEPSEPAVTVPPPLPSERVAPYVFGGCNVWFNFEDSIKSILGDEHDTNPAGCKVGFGFPTFDKWALEFSFGNAPNVEALDVVVGPNNNNVRVETKQSTKYWTASTFWQNKINDKFAGILKIGLAQTRQSATTRPITEDSDKLPVTDDKKSFLDPFVTAGIVYSLTRSSQHYLGSPGSIDLFLGYTKRLESDIFTDSLELHWRISFPGVFRP